MPVYEYECYKGHRFEEWNTIDNRHNQTCPKCGMLSKLLVSCPAFKKPSNYEYYDEHLDTHITGPAHRERVMKEQGVFCKAEDNRHSARPKIKHGRKIIVPMGATA